MTRQQKAYLFLEQLAMEADAAGDSFGGFIRDHINPFWEALPEDLRRTMNTATPAPSDETNPQNADDLEVALVTLKKAAEEALGVASSLEELVGRSSKWYHDSTLWEEDKDLDWQGWRNSNYPKIEALDNAITAAGKALSGARKSQKEWQAQGVNMVADYLNKQVDLLRSINKHAARKEVTLALSHCMTLLWSLQREDDATPSS